MSSILLGKNRVSEAEVIAVPDVAFTKTFHPVHHREIIGAIKQSLSTFGLEIVKAEYILAAEGKKLFSVWDLNQGNSNLCWSIGIRNSMDRSLAFGITCGSRVFICDNLAFSGEYITFRRHTSGLDADELVFLAYRALRTMIPKLQAFEQWHEGLKKHLLPQSDMRVLLVEIMEQNVIPVTRFHDFTSLFGKAYDDSLWGFHESATEILRESNLMTLPQKNKLLNQVINNYIGSLSAANEISRLGDFYQQRYLIHP